MVRIENDNVFTAELEQLRSRGFFKQSQNLALLKRTNGNVEVVAKFLEAKKAFRDASESDRLEKKALKKGFKKLKKRGVEDFDEIKAEKDEVKKEHKKLKKLIEKSEDAEKSEKKELKKAEKLAKKLAKIEAKEAKKLAKKEAKTKGQKYDEAKDKAKEQKRAEKKAQKEAHRKELEAFVLPENITTVFLDGNNMLFVVKALRARVLRRNMREAEAMLELMAQSWCDANPQLKNVTLIFDDTKTNKFSDRFNVCSARPNFPTSDHALVHWCQNANPTDKPSIAVFTSDRALKDDLVKAGVTVFKSKVWFHVASKSLATGADENVNNTSATTTTDDQSEKNDLDAWANEWLAKHFEKMNV